MTPKLPVFSKDDSNIDGSLVSFSEDDCNTWNLLGSWTWYHKGEHVWELLYP